MAEDVRETSIGTPWANMIDAAEWRSSWGCQRPI